MKNFFSILIILAIAAGISWEFFEPEIRSFIGLALTQGEYPSKADKSQSSNQQRSSPKTTTISEAEATPGVSADELKFKALIAQRYPDVPPIPFEEFCPDIRDLPSRCFPDQISISKPLALSLIHNGALIATSLVRTTGSVRPESITNGVLTVTSLADRKMKAEIAVEMTDFEKTVRKNFLSIQEQARERVEVMRQADLEEFQSSIYLRRKFIRGNRPWPEESKNEFQIVRDFLSKEYPDGEYVPVGFFDLGSKAFGSDSPYAGKPKVVVVALEGYDQGFGPYLWRAQCLLKGSRLVGWLDLPQAR